MGAGFSGFSGLGGAFISTSLLLPPPHIFFRAWQELFGAPTRLDLENHRR
jgi:hypothetical protein